MKCMHSLHRFASIIVLSFFLFLTGVSGQTKQKSQEQKAAQGTIRVNVGLVQTDVMVFDKQGRFIPDLKMDQFELRIDGKVQPIEFFEMVAAGSVHDEEIWAKVGNRPLPAAESRIAANPGRTLLFFVDDWHLSEDSVMRSRTALSNLINTTVDPNDKVAIFAASGQLGSAQILTGDKSQLLAIAAKLNFQSAGAQDLQFPPMTEAQAMLIDQNDINAITYLVQAIIGKPVVKDSQFGWKLPTDTFGSMVASDCGRAEEATRKRAAALVQTSAGIAERSLGGLRNLLAATEKLPGRKVVFFLSDGFVLQYQRSDVVSRITDMTTSAARAGILIYTLDTRGLVVGLPDAKTKRGGDMTGALASSGANETTSPQDALNALAVDTGGRFLRNTNALDTALITTINEMSRYYLLGWSINPEKIQQGKRSTIKASIKGRSDLTVRVRQGSLDLSKLVQDKK